MWAVGDYGLLEYRAFCKTSKDLLCHGIGEICHMELEQEKASQIYAQATESFLKSESYPSHT